MFDRLVYIVALTVASLNFGFVPSGAVASMTKQQHTHSARASEPAVSQAAGIVMTKTVSSTPSGCGAANTLTVFEGSQVTYCYTVRNTGDVTLTLHSLVDTQLGVILNSFPFVLAPSATTFVTRSTTLAQTTANGATWSASDGVVSVAASNAATVTVTPSADLSISKISSPSRVPVSSPLGYTIIVTNNGPSTANNVSLQDTLPAGLSSPVIATTLGTCNIVNLVVTCQLGTMNAGTSATIAIGAQAPPSRGVIINTATVSSPNDPNASNNTASVATAVLAPGIVLMKTVGTNANACATTSAIAVPASTLMTYCYTVQNTGDYTFTTHTLTDTQLGTVVSNLPLSLAPGASTFITRSAVIGQNTTNTAYWTATDGTNTANASSSATVGVGPVSDLVITKLDSPDPVTISHRLTYTIRITNNGPAAATNVTVTDQLPPGVSLTGLAINPAAARSAAGTVTFALDSLAPGESVPFVIGVKAPPTIGVITNMATVTATNEYLTVNNTAQITTTVTAYMLYFPFIARNGSP